MRQQTRFAFTKLNAQLAGVYGVSTLAEGFSVEPSMHQKIETKIQESSAFLGMIGIYPVNEIKGEKIGLSVADSIAGRTNTDGDGERKTRSIFSLDSNKYECVAVEFDSHLKYKVLDSWAKFPDFQLRVRGAAIKRQALDLIKIGFNGVSASDTTDRVAKPMLQDVAKGWVQYVRENATEQVEETPILIGEKQTYKNLDAAVRNIYSTNIKEEHRDGTQYVVILGEALLEDKYFPIVNKHEQPTEQLAADIVISQKRIGGLQAVTVPFIPEGMMIITPLDNLSIYWQEGSRRLQMIDNPRKNQIENFEVCNYAWVVEDLNKVVVIESIKLDEEPAE